MSTETPSPSPADVDAAWNRFDKTTSRWGRITMILALISMVGGPALLAAQLDVPVAGVVTGVVAILVAFGIVMAIEPLAYFPILGSASMYQAFMIGNISNKLLPAAVVAQSTIGAEPGTKRGQFASVLAICGAAVVHLASLALFVGLLGSVISRAIPENVAVSVQTYILPAIMGAVVVQAIASSRQPRVIAIALAVGAVVTFVLAPLVPAIGPFAIALTVAATILLALFLPGASKKQDAAASSDAP
ncbi:hypothetical protein [Microbacterium sp. No. 7]|uniref:hypothetical protein n=1 Tax=Microbacterium sp. No. 7 TaxID=1714373 RepID=UPI0006CFDF44|nr:hypothetical protein [Microbacterium sp. No. 7]ALJ19903.1 hypothetical protein AOA12_08285 [Microbacterium sp. No. 7]